MPTQAMVEQLAAYLTQFRRTFLELQQQIILFTGLGCGLEKYPYGKTRYT